MPLRKGTYGATQQTKLPREQVDSELRMQKSLPHSLLPT